MSAALASRVFPLKGISRTDKMTLLALAMRASDTTGKCVAPVIAIARDARLCERSVQNSLRRLERSGLVRNRPRPRCPSEYTLALPEIAA